mgnify:CR=1 FL=1
MKPSLPRFTAALSMFCPRAGRRYLQRANSKLCFLLHDSRFAAENSLPARGRKHLRSRCFSERRQAAKGSEFSGTGRLWPLLKISMRSEKNRKPRGGKGGRPAKNVPGRFTAFSVNFFSRGTCPFPRPLRAVRAIVQSPLFIKARVFNEAFRVVKTDRGTLEYVAKLTAFHAQFRAIGTNYNQVVKELHAHFSEKKTLALLYKLERATRELAAAGSRSCRSPKSSNNDGSQYHHRKRRVRRAGVQPGESQSGHGKVLLTHIVREPVDGRFNVAATAEDLLRWMPSHYRTEKPVVHVSLNPAPEDRLDDGQLAEIAGAYMERMGWGGQPYIVFKHTDIGREHIHIVSYNILIIRILLRISEKMRDSK